MLDTRNFSLRPGRVEAFVVGIFDKLKKQGVIPVLVEQYATLGEIEPDRFTPQIKSAMVDYLVDRGFQPNVIAFNRREYDEHFALAYSYAVDVVSGRSDPIDGVRQGGARPGGTTKSAPSISSRSWESSPRTSSPPAPSTISTSWARICGASRSVTSCYATGGTSSSRSPATNSTTCCTPPF